VRLYFTLRGPTVADAERMGSIVGKAGQAYRPTGKPIGFIR